MRPGRDCIRLSRVLASAVSSLMLRLARLAGDLFSCEQHRLDRVLVLVPAPGGRPGLQRFGLISLVPTPTLFGGGARGDRDPGPVEGVADLLQLNFGPRVAQRATLPCQVAVSGSCS